MRLAVGGHCVEFGQNADDIRTTLGLSGVVGPQATGSAVGGAETWNRLFDKYGGNRLRDFD
jgi:hypothetical protein